MQSQDYTSKLLKDCKSWGGPCTSGDELISVLHCNPQIQEQIVKTELALYSHSHQSERITRPELFKMNRVSHNEKLHNMMVILGDDEDGARSTVTDLPTNEDVRKALSLILGNTTNRFGTMSTKISTCGGMCIVVWRDGENNLYI